jgi:hypothetical protein
VGVVGLEAFGRAGAHGPREFALCATNQHCVASAIIGHVDLLYERYG